MASVDDVGSDELAPGRYGLSVTVRQPLACRQVGIGCREVELPTGDAIVVEAMGVETNRCEDGTGCVAGECLRVAAQQVNVDTSALDIPDDLGVETNVVLRVGGCSGIEAHSFPAESDSLTPGLYGVEARVADSHCRVFARRCEEMMLPNAPVTLSLENLIVPPQTCGPTATCNSLGVCEDNVPPWHTGTGDAFACAWRRGGFIYCWGTSDSGGLGTLDAHVQSWRPCPEDATQCVTCEQADRSFELTAPMSCGGKTCGDVDPPSCVPVLKADVPVLVRAGSESLIVRDAAVGGRIACAIASVGGDTREALYCWGTLHYPVTNQPHFELTPVQVPYLQPGDDPTNPPRIQRLSCENENCILQLSTGELRTLRGESRFVISGAECDCDSLCGCSAAEPADTCECDCLPPAGDLPARCDCECAAVQQMDSSTTHSCVLEADEVSCFGNSLNGRLGGEPGESPIRSVDGPQYVALSVGESHSCALSNTGEVWCWGDTCLGQQGGDRPDFPTAPRPNDALGCEHAMLSVPPHALEVPLSSHLALGNLSTCYAEYWSGAIRCVGQISGDGLKLMPPTVAEPLQVQLLESVAVPLREIAVGVSFGCYSTGRDVRCFGRNDRGQLGRHTADATQWHGAARVSGL